MKLKQPKRWNGTTQSKQFFESNKLENITKFEFSRDLFLIFFSASSNTYELSQKLHEILHEERKKIKNKWLEISWNIRCVLKRNLSSIHFDWNALIIEKLEPKTECAIYEKYKRSQKQIDNLNI